MRTGFSKFCFTLLQHAHARAPEADLLLLCTDAVVFYTYFVSPAGLLLISLLWGCI